MIHDIDIVLSLVKSNIKKISASGVAVASSTPDICNARLEFDNGCVANLTASRISLKNMRKSRFFQPNAYISVDFFEKSVEIVQLEEFEGEPDPLAVIWPGGENGRDKRILFQNPEVPESNAIKEELRTFAVAINENKEPAVPLHDGALALEVAHGILDKLKLHPSLVS
jgi:predicted dehydrogenase